MNGSQSNLDFSVRCFRNHNVTSQLQLAIRDMDTGTRGARTAVLGNIGIASLARKR